MAAVSHGPHRENSAMGSEGAALHRASCLESCYRSSKELSVILALLALCEALREGMRFWI